MDITTAGERLLHLRAEYRAAIRDRDTVADQLVRARERVERAALELKRLAFGDQEPE